MNNPLRIICNDLVDIEKVSSFARDRIKDLDTIQYITDYLKQYANAPNCRGTVQRYSDNHRAVIMWYIELNPDITDTVAFSAHFDVVNTRAHNVFDNLGSVAHLLLLAERFAHIDPVTVDLPKHNILLCFVDGEEVGHTGSFALSRYMRNSKFPYGDVIQVWNLELTALGSHTWIDNTPGPYVKVFKDTVKNSTKMSYVSTICPANDAMAYRSGGINSNCVGTLTRGELEKLKTSGRTPKQWRYCHSHKDDLSSADFDHMLKFNDFLYELSISPHVPYSWENDRIVFPDYFD